MSKRLPDSSNFNTELFLFYILPFQPGSAWCRLYCLYGGRLWVHQAQIGPILWSGDWSFQGISGRLLDWFSLFNLFHTHSCEDSHANISSSDSIGMEQLSVTIKQSLMALSTDSWTWRHSGRTSEGQGYSRSARLNMLKTNIFKDLQRTFVDDLLKSFDVALWRGFLCKAQEKAKLSLLNRHASHMSARHGQKRFHLEHSCTSTSFGGWLRLKANSRCKGRTSLWNSCAGSRLKR